MKRLAVLILTAGLVGLGGSLRAADPIPAPTVPTIPAPVFTGSAVAPANATGPAVAVHPRGPAEKTLHAPRQVSGVSAAQPYGPVAANPPPPPVAGVVAAPVPTPAPAAVIPAGCDSCDSCNSSACWAKFKAWLCYRPTPVKLGLTPTPYMAPLGMQFPCVSATGCGPAGCAKGPVGGTGTCATAACGPRVASGLPCRGTAGGCTAVAADPVLPGYRFATPANQNAGAPVNAAPVVTTSFKQPTTPGPVAAPTSQKPAAPAALVPYKSTGQK
jgi:hypothetical protein